MCVQHFRMLTLIGGDRPVSTHTQVTKELQYAMVLEERGRKNPNQCNITACHACMHLTVYKTKY